MTPDPTPEEELPPRMRFEGLVEGPEPSVFESVSPEDVVEAASETPLSPDSEDTDESILERFDTLKRTLGEEARPEVSVAPPTTEPPPVWPDYRWSEAADSEPKQDAEESEPVSEGSLNELQARIHSARQEERAVNMQPPVPAAEDSDASLLTYDELEKFKKAEAKRRQREANKERRRQKRKNRSFWKELPILVLVALVVAIIIKTFFFQAFYIPSGSMIPTLEINDRVLVNKLSYRFGAIERGDILVFDSPEAVDLDRSLVERMFRSVGEATGLTSPETVLIKRVIGLPGETVSVRDNQVYVNGNPIAEPYLADGTSMRDFEEVSVGADHVFMMGDNRNQSRDSRVFGAIPREDIVGRAFVTVWPPGAWGGL